MGATRTSKEKMQFYIDFDVDPPNGYQGIFHVGKGCYGHGHDFQELVGCKIVAAEMDEERRIVLTVEK